MIRIGCLGPEGTFSQYALYEYARNQNIIDFQEIQFSTIGEAVAAVDHGEIDCAIVPIENSLEGAVNTTLDSIAMADKLKIIYEMKLSIHHHLLANCEPFEIQKIYSHPQPVGQCAKYLAQNFANVQIEFTSSTAEAAKAASKEKYAAALGGDLLSDLYQLKIVQSCVEDNESNTTRFIILSKEENINKDSDKTSIVFGVEDKPGSLYKILSIFDIFEINMARIESRPAKTVLGEYVFFVDLVGNNGSRHMKKALSIVEYKTSFFKNFGSYKSAE